MVKIRDHHQGDTYPAKLANTSDDEFMYLDLDPEIDYECWMPEETDGEQFNLYIMVNKIIYAVMNIDFE